MLPSLFRWNRGRGVPVRREESPFVSLHREMNRLFEDFWHGFDLAPSGPFAEDSWTFSPRVDVEETDAEVRVTAELPGLDEKSFELTLEEDSLTLSGEKSEEREDKSHGWRERSYGRFERTIPLPRGLDTDAAKAEFKKGVLTVRLPKTAEARKRGRRVPVEAS